MNLDRNLQIVSDDCETFHVRRMMAVRALMIMHRVVLQVKKRGFGALVIGGMEKSGTKRCERDSKQLCLASREPAEWTSTKRMIGD